MLPIDKNLDSHHSTSNATSGEFNELQLEQGLNDAFNELQRQAANYSQAGLTQISEWLDPAKAC